MRRIRKTVAQVRAEQEERSVQAWDRFYPKLKEVRSFPEALVLLSNAPSQTSPGRRFYSNFGFFMHTFSPPLGASAAELNEYARLVGCFDDEGALKPGVRQSLEDALRHAAAERQWSR